MMNWINLDRSLCNHAGMAWHSHRWASLSGAHLYPRALRSGLACNYISNSAECAENNLFTELALQLNALNLLNHLDIWSDLNSLVCVLKFRTTLRKSTIKAAWSICPVMWPNKTNSKKKTSISLCRESYFYANAARGCAPLAPFTNTSAAVEILYANSKINSNLCCFDGGTFGSNCIRLWVCVCVCLSNSKWWWENLPVLSSHVITFAEQIVWFVNVDGRWYVHNKCGCCCARTNANVICTYTQKLIVAWVNETRYTYAIDRRANS